MSEVEKAKIKAVHCPECGKKILMDRAEIWKVVKCEGRKGHVIKNMKDNKEYEI